MAIHVYIATLRNLLPAAAGISDVWNYFFDHLATNPDFLDASEPCKSADLESKIEVAARSIFGKAKTRVKHGLWLQVPAHGLIHGSCSVEGCVTTALYFPDIQTGVAAIQRGGSSIMQVRFSPPDLARIPASSGIQ